MIKPALAGSALCVTALGLGYWLGAQATLRDVLAPVEPVRVVEAGLGYRARLDTGAVVSSIHAEDIEVRGGAPVPGVQDVGKPVRFVLVNEAGERRAVVAEVAQVRGVRMADCREVRYHVHLTIQHRGRAHRVLVNLNDRSQAGDKLLLGRNWLRQGYAVGPVEEGEL